MTTPFHKPDPDPAVPPIPPAEVSQFLAGSVMLQRLGASSFEFRLSEPDSELDDGPAVFVSIAVFTNPSTRWDAAAGVTPLESMTRLLDALMDGGQCQHCHKPTGAAHDLGEMPLPEHVCWYQYDPELTTYRRSCE